MNSNLEIINKNNNEKIVFDTLNFGKRITLDLAVRFSIADIISEYHSINPVVLLDMPGTGLDQAFREGLLEIFTDVIKSRRWQLVVTTEDRGTLEKFENKIDLSGKVSEKIKTHRQLRLEEFLNSPDRTP